MTAAKRQEIGHLVERVWRPHTCWLPGWLYRLRHRIGEGSVWECACGQRWKWIYENYAGGPEWKRC